MTSEPHCQLHVGQDAPLVQWLDMTNCTLKNMLIEIKLEKEEKKSLNFVAMVKLGSQD